MSHFFEAEIAKSHFFKGFTQPHFNYCAALTVYLNKTQVNSIEKFHKVVLFRLLQVKLFGLDSLSQLPLLQQFNLMPYRLRLCSRLIIFSHKVVNNVLLSSFGNNLLFKENCCNISSCTGACSRRKQLVSVPDIRTNFGRQSFAYFFPMILNVIIKENYKMNT